MINNIGYETIKSSNYGYLYMISEVIQGGTNRNYRYDFLRYYNELTYIQIAEKKTKSASEKYLHKKKLLKVRV